MFVNFEVGAFKKRIKLKGTDGPLVSHHGVFRPRAPAVATGPPPPPIPTVPPCPTPPRAPPAATHRSERAHVRQPRDRPYPLASLSLRSSP
jgi:hypothetical protein